MSVVQGIMISEAATVVENAFRDVLGFDENALAQLSLDHKFELYCDSDQLKIMRNFIRTDSGGGLPSMNPTRTIQIEALSGVSTSSTIRTMVRRVSDYAFYTIP